MTNAEIIQSNYSLIRDCVYYQVKKYSFGQSHINDIMQDVCLILMEYDNAKLDIINNENHLNAFITGILVRQLYSKCSSMYKKYRRFSLTTDDISVLDPGETSYEMYE